MGLRCSSYSDDEATEATFERLDQARNRERLRANREKKRADEAE